MSAFERYVERLDQAADAIDGVRDVAKNTGPPFTLVNIDALDEASRLVREEARLLAKRIREAGA